MTFLWNRTASASGFGNIAFMNYNLGQAPYTIYRSTILQCRMYAAHNYGTTRRIESLLRLFMHTSRNGLHLAQGKEACIYVSNISRVGASNPLNTVSQTYHNPERQCVLLFFAHDREFLSRPLFLFLNFLAFSLLILCTFQRQ